MARQTSTLRDCVRRLRREQTEVERRLWARLRDRQVSGAKFRRQHPIGRFIADFCCPERGLVVELDGSQHAAQVEADRKRTAFLVQRGYRVLRFWDNEVVDDIEAVLQQIVQVLGDPRPNPLPAREREKRSERARRLAGSLRRYAKPGAARAVRAHVKREVARAAAAEGTSA